MENPASLGLGIGNIYKYYKKEYYNSQIVFKINLVIILSLHLFMVYQIFYKDVIINFFDYKYGYILFIFFLGYTYFPLDMVLVEFGIWKKSTLNTKFLNYTKQLLESSEKKYSKPNETTKLQDEVIMLNKKTSNNSEYIKSIKDDLTKVEGGLIKGNKNHRDSVINEYESTKILANKNSKEIIIINKKISVNKKFKIEKINILPDNSNKSIEIKLIEIKKIFKDYKNLFKSLDIDNFIGMAFRGDNKNNPKKLKKEELDNVFAIILLLIKANKIKSIDSELSRIFIKYFNLNETPRTTKNRITRIKKEDIFLTSKTNANNIIEEISKI